MPIDDKMLEDLLSEEFVTPKKNMDSALELVAEKDRSLKFACVGLGQAGGRLAAEFYKLGYAAVAINTAQQDLVHIGVPNRKKMLLDLGLSGAGKSLERGEEAIVQYSDEITSFLESELVGDSEMIFVAFSGGGGSGSGGAEKMIEILSKFGKPLACLYVLPLTTDDSVAKKNSLVTLAKLARLSKTNVISSLLIVDNSRIETLLGHLSQDKFWATANESIVKPIHIFNTLTNTASQYTSLDSSDFGKVLTTGDISLIGSFEVEDYEEETALAEAAVKSFASNMLAEGFDLKGTRTCGIIVTGRKESLDKVSANSLNYMYHMISEQTNSAATYRGMYVVDNGNSNIKIYSWLSGLGLPVERINSLKAESVMQTAQAEEKEHGRANSMNLELGEKTITAAADIHKKIQQKNSAFNKLSGGIIDRRKK